MGFSLDIVPPGTEEENSSTTTAAAASAIIAPREDPTQIIFNDRNSQNINSNNNNNEEDSEREEGEIIESLEYEDISSDEEINLRQRIEELEARNLEYEKIATISTAGKVCDFDYGISNFVDLVDSSSDNDPNKDANNYSTNYIYNGSNNSASRYQNYHQHRSKATQKKSSRRKKEKQGSSFGAGISKSDHKHDRKKSRHSTNINSANSSNKHKHSSNLNNTIADKIDDDYVYGSSNKSYHRTSNKSRNHTIQLNSSSDDNDEYENDYYYLKDDSYLSTTARDDFRPRRNVLRAALKGSLSVTNKDNSSSLLKKLRGVQNCVKEFIKIKSKEDHNKEETATSIEIMQLLNTLTDENLLNGQHTTNEQQQIIIDDSQDEPDDEDDDDEDDDGDDDDNDNENNGKKKYKSSSPLPILHPPPPTSIRPSLNESISLEEQELRLIALKSAILKKHEQRKKRKIIEQQRPYSPTDTDNFINLLESSSKTDLTNNPQHNEDNFKIAQIENMDISPAVSPIYTIDMSLQPIDMDLASSSDDDGGDDRLLQTSSLSPQPPVELSSLQSQHQQQHQMVNNNTSWDIMNILTPPPPPPPPPPPLPALPLLNVNSSFNMTENQSPLSCSQQNNLFQASLSSNSSLPPPPPPPRSLLIPTIQKSTITTNKIINNNDVGAGGGVDDDEEENALRQLLLTTTRTFKMRKIDYEDKKPNPKLPTEKLVIEDEQKTLDISLEAEELRKLLLKSLSNKKDEQKENVARINNIPTEQIKATSSLKDHQILQNKKLIISSSSSNTSSSSTTTTSTATAINTINPINPIKKLVPIINQKDNKQIVSKNNTTTTATVIQTGTAKKRLAPTSTTQTNLLVIKKPKIIDIKQNQHKKSKIITSLEVKTVPKMIIRLDNSDSDTDFNGFNDDDGDISDQCVDDSYFDNASPVSLSMDSPAYSAPASPITVLPSNTPNENTNNTRQTEKTGGSSTKSTNDLSTATLFQQQLDKFLKIARTKVEKTKITSVPNNKPSNITKKNILTTKSSKIITIPKTPQVVQHLPFSSQIEYHRLINRMSLLEKQKKVKLKIAAATATTTTVSKQKNTMKNVAAVSSSSSSSTETITNTFQSPLETNATTAAVNDKNVCNNKTLTVAIVNNERIVEEKSASVEEISTIAIKPISDESNSLTTASSSLINECKTNKPIDKLPESDKKGDIIKIEKPTINKLSPSKLAINPAHLNEKERTELLTNSESQYSDQSSTFLNDLDTMYKLVYTAQQTRTKIFHIEEEKEELLLKLKKLDENLNKEKKYLLKLYPTIAGSHKDILRDRKKCIQLSNNCFTMGKLLHGSGYKIPHDKRDILLEKMKKISEATKKLKTMNKNDSKKCVISDMNVKKENPVNVVVKTNQQMKALETISPQQVQIKEKEMNTPIKEIKNNGDINMETSTTTTTTPETLSLHQLDDGVIDELTTGMSTYKSPLDYKQQSSSANPNGVICPFQLMGQCEDKDCRYEHIPTTAADNNDNVNGGKTKTTSTITSL